MTLKEIRFSAQRLRKSIPRPLIWIGFPLAILLCFALFFHSASLGNVVRDFSMNGTQYDVGFGGMHGQQLYQDLADFLKEFAQFAWANALQTEDVWNCFFQA